MRRVAVWLSIAALVSACSGTVPTTQGPTSPSPSDSPSTQVQGSALSNEEIQALAAADAHPLSLANSTEDRLIGLLADASGLSAALGGERDAALAALALAERQAVSTELEGLGGVPDWSPLEPESTGATHIGGALLAVARDPVPEDGPMAGEDDALASFLLVVLAVTADLVDPGRQQTDTRGHVERELSVETNATYLGFTLEIDEVTHFNLERCPDTIGHARGTINISIAVRGTSSSGGTFGAIGELQISVRGTANDHADLIEIAGRTDGDLGAEGDGQGAQIASANVLSITTPVSGGSTDRGAARRSGSYSGPSDFGSALLSFGYILASKHAFAAEEYWAGGSCISLGIDPPNPRVEGTNRTTEVTVSADSVRDQTAAEGTLTVTPSRGTFTPTQGDTPLRIRVTVPKGANSATAELEFRSVRGVGRRALAVNASAPLEWSVTLMQEGPLEVPGVASANGHSDLQFRLRATKDLAELFSPDPDGSHELVPLTLVSATFEWYAKGSALGSERTLNGSTSRIVDLDYSDPFWLANLPAGNYIAGEGLVDPVERKLYVFILASGDLLPGGTFNIPPETQCQVERFTNTYQTFLVFDLDDENQVAPGSCTSTIRATGTGGGFTVPWTTTWLIIKVQTR